MNCYLLHVPRLPSQPSSNVWGLVIDWTGLNWLESTKLWLEITYVLFQFPLLHRCLRNVHLRHQSIINFFFLYRNANFLCHPNDRKLNTQLWKNEVWAKMGGLGEGGRPQGRRNRGGRGTMALSDFRRKRCKTFTFERPLITTSPLDFQIFLRPLSAGQMAVHYT